MTQGPINAILMAISHLAHLAPSSLGGPIRDRGSGFYFDLLPNRIDSYRRHV